MKSIARLMAVVAMGSLPVFAYGTAAASAQSASGAERIVETALYDMSDSTFFFSCGPNGERLPETDGEPIDIEGQIFERISFVYDPAGGMHFNLDTMPVDLSGIGLLSGEEFRVVETDKYIANQRLAGVVGAWRQTFSLIGKDTHRSFTIVSTGSYTISAEGRPMRSRSEVSIECGIR
jgi:hypothetical protein